jgi:MFS family permease
MTSAAQAAGQSGGRLFSGNFIFAILANFSNAFGMQMLVATLPVYVISMGGSRIEAGTVSGALAFAALVFRPLAGWLTDSWNRRPLVLIGTSCYGFASIIYMLAGSIPVLLAGRVLHGFGLSCYTTASNAYVADISPLRRLAEAIGLFSAAQALGLIVGPVVGFVIIGWSGFRYLFHFTAALAFTAFAISAFTREERPRGWEKKRQWSLRTGIVLPEALPVAWMTLCMGIGFGTVSAFIAIYAQTRGLQNPGYYFMFMALALLISRTFAGRLADRHGRASAIIPGVIVMAAALAMLPPAHSLPYFVVSASLFGLGFGTAQPASMALLIDRVRPEKRGLATSTYFTGFDLGIAIGSILLGVAGERFGFGVMWPVSAACTLLSLAGFLADGRRSGPGRQ